MGDDPEGAHEFDLVGQDRNEVRIAGGHEIRQDAEPGPGFGGVELREQVGAGKPRRQPVADLAEIVELRREDQFRNIADQGVAGEILPACYRAVFLLIAARAIDMQRVVGELARVEPALVRPFQPDGDVRLALCQAEDPRHGDDLQFQLRVSMGEFTDARRQEERAETIRRADADNAAERELLPGDLVLDTGGRTLDRFSLDQQPLAGIGERVAPGRTLKQFGAELPFQSGDASAHRRMICTHAPSCSGQPTGACHRKKITQIVPIECHGV